MTGHLKIGNTKGLITNINTKYNKVFIKLEKDREKKYHYYKRRKRIRNNSTNINIDDIGKSIRIIDKEIVYDD